MLTATDNRMPRELADQIEAAAEPLKLTVPIDDPIVLAYLMHFRDELRVEKAAEALKVGVIAIQSASPTLDMSVVQSKFAEVEERIKDQVAEFTEQITDHFGHYFKDKDGQVPRSLEGFLGQDGRLARMIQAWFHPSEGQLCKLMDAQVGPKSLFAQSLDPKNKDGILTLIEARVHKLVENQLKDVLAQFSLDEEESAMSRLKGLLDDGFQKLNVALNIKAAKQAEAARGHVKGIEFEADLYDAFAAMGRQLGDETELVRGTVGAVQRSKDGDFVATLGETAGAPGVKLVVEVKESPWKLKEAVAAIDDAKKNREAAIGIFVFAKGSEPAEVGDFRRIGEDFYCTVDKDDLAAAKPLLFLDAAYKIARALAVAAARREAAGGLDLEAIEQHVRELLGWVDRIGEMAAKARTIQTSGKFIEDRVNELKDELDRRLNEMLQVLARAE